MTEQKRNAEILDKLTLRGKLAREQLKWAQFLKQMIFFLHSNLILCAMSNGLFVFLFGLVWFCFTIHLFENTFHVKIFWLIFREFKFRWSFIWIITFTNGIKGKKNNYYFYKRRWRQIDYNFNEKKTLPDSSHYLQ